MWKPRGNDVFCPRSFVSQGTQTWTFFSALPGCGLEVTPGGQSIKSIFFCTDINMHI